MFVRGIRALVRMQILALTCKIAMQRPMDYTWTRQMMWSGEERESERVKKTENKEKNIIDSLYNRCFGTVRV